MRWKRGTLVLIAVFGLAGSAVAQSEEECATCHGRSDLKASNGRAVFIDKVLFNASPHGQADIKCLDCHTSKTAEPSDKAPHSVPMSVGSCAECHQELSDAHTKSGHATAGVECTACHNPHAPGPGLVHAKRVERCAECHSTEDSHAWLPEKQHHMAAVECAACHGSGAKRQAILELRVREPGGLRPLTQEESTRVTPPLAAEPGASGSPALVTAEQLTPWLQSLKVAGLGEVELATKVLMDQPAHDFTTKPEDAKQCQSCHAEQPKLLQSFLLEVPNADGKVKLVPVERAAVPLRAMGKFSDSVHGRAGVACTDCHQEMPGVAEVRAGGVKKLDSIVCANCHAQQFEQYRESMHARVSDQVCFGCHNPHASVPFRSLRAEERQAICLQCHQSARHDWLPQQSLHLKFLECTTCHSPKSRKGISFTFEAAATGKKLDHELLEAFKVGDGGTLVPEIDKDKDGVASANEMLEFVQRAAAVIPGSPRLRPEVLILESDHDFAGGSQKVKQCAICHSAGAEFYDKLFAQLPAPGGGVTSLAVDREILDRMQSARQLGDLYLMGESRISREDIKEVFGALKQVGYRWIDIVGLLILLGALGFVGLHALLRVLTIPKRRRPRP